VSDAAPTLSLRPHRQTCERLGISTRTGDRWIALGILPPPTVIRRRKYHAADVQPRADIAGNRRKAEKQHAVAADCAAPASTGATARTSTTVSADCKIPINLLPK
jgi:hypothetical protein